MKAITKFVDEVSGKEFSSQKEAITSEKRSKDIQDAFSFYEERPMELKDYVGVQRDKEFYDKLINALTQMIRRYEPQIVESHKKWGRFTSKNVSGYSLCGRYLGDEHSDLYRWWQIQLNICPNCYKEYGQAYFAVNCKCSQKCLCDSCKTTEYGTTLDGKSKYIKHNFDCRVLSSYQTSTGR